MKYFFLILLFCLPAIAGPYKIKVFAEPIAEERAREYIKNMKELEPFKQLIEQNALVIENSPKRF